MTLSRLGFAVALTACAVARSVPTAAAAEQQLSDRAVTEIVQAIHALRTELQTQRSFPEIQQVREAQKIFLRGNAKFPDYLDVGVDVWLSIYDWHIRWQQPLSVGRDPAGRYTLPLMGTQLIMRLDTLPNYIGLPYDNTR